MAIWLGGGTVPAVLVTHTVVAGGQHVSHGTGPGTHQQSPCAACCGGFESLLHARSLSVIGSGGLCCGGSVDAQSPGGLSVAAGAWLP